MQDLDLALTLSLRQSGHDLDDESNLFVFQTRLEEIGRKATPVAVLKIRKSFMECREVSISRTDALNFVWLQSLGFKMAH